MCVFNLCVSKNVLLPFTLLVIHFWALVQLFHVYIAPWWGKMSHAACFLRRLSGVCCTRCSLSYCADSSLNINRSREQMSVYHIKTINTPCPPTLNLEVIYRKSMLPASGPIITEHCTFSVINSKLCFLRDEQWDEINIPVLGVELLHVFLFRTSSSVFKADTKFHSSWLYALNKNPRLNRRN